MLETDRKTIKIKFDAVHAVLLVDVLQQCAGTAIVNHLLFELAAFCPPKLTKV
jgi:hypothetical protein